MNIKITARKFKAHDSLKEYVKDEVSSLEKFNDEILDVDVILSFQNQSNSIKTAEIIVKVPGQVLKAEGDSEEFKISVANAVEKLRRQLKKLKTKRIPHI
ncbi:MAG TPA: ribosome-associated translation inhibitor RaiA [Ignavibacteriaceae bacterium]|jgi:putative sigma-54 modulation protein|nr:ribosome-associated translation inhibitor RaiA [Ignavibacteriaceae bacterium]